MANPSSVRFDPAVLRRLQDFVRSHPGLTLSSGANLLVDEALRTASHPLVCFVDGPGGRRACLGTGPSVDQVITALIGVRDAHPELTVDEILEQVARDAGLPISTIQAAVEYWAEFPDEVDFRIELGRGTAARAQRASGLLD